MSQEDTEAEGRSRAPAPAAEADPIGRVHSWELVTARDGPGTRLVTWLSGCPLRCLYCHNPDTWNRASGTPTRVSEHVRVLDRYRRFLRITGGGVTISGGEPLTQPEFVTGLLRAAKDRGLHTALDTSGYAGGRVGDELLDLCDLVLLDLKSADRDAHRRLTSRDLLPTVEFADRLVARGIPIWVRFVLAPGLTDDPATVEGVAELAARLATVERVDVLPYHDAGRDKYTLLGLAYPLPDTPAPTGEQLRAAQQIFREAGLTVF